MKRTLVVFLTLILIVLSSSCGIKKEESVSVKDTDLYSEYKIDTAEIKKLGVELVERNLLEDHKDGLIRHSCTKVAKAIYYWYKRAIKK